MTNKEMTFKYGLKELEEALYTLADESSQCALRLIGGDTAYVNATCRENCGECIHDWFNTEVGKKFY